MKREKRLLLQVFTVLGIITLLGMAGIFAANEEVEIIGTVYAADWDSSDKVIGVVIETIEGEVIGVSKASAGSELVKCEGKMVRATGSITTDEEGVQTITVTKYSMEE